MGNLFFRGLLLFFFPLYSVDASRAPFVTKKALQKKSHFYAGRHIFYGGSALSSLYQAKKFRWGEKKNYERIVWELASLQMSSKASLPYFQVGVLSSKKSIQLGIHHINENEIDRTLVKKKISRSKLIDNIYIHPQLHRGILMAQVSLKNASLVEVFTLSHPPRIVIDVKR